MKPKKQIRSHFSYQIKDKLITYVWFRIEYDTLRLINDRFVYFCLDRIKYMIKEELKKGDYDET